MSSKKIEQGCTALIIKSRVISNVGLSVTVGEYLGEVYGYDGKDRWVIDGNVSVTTSGGMSLSEIAGHVNEDQLMRIDDFDESQEDHTTVDDTLLVPS